MAERDPIVGRTVAGKFLVEELLGGGAMGSVYRARQIALDKLVAIKILHHEMAADPAFVERFHREALAASRLDHPSSVRVLDFGEDEGLLYIVMEYLAGRDLLTVMNDEWPLDDVRVALILSQVLAALAVAHDHGIVHRDLKPENIMVMPAYTDDGEPMDLVKVCDFGIATIAGAVDDDPTAPRLTAKGLVMGTPDYMSPEQARGERLDHRTDLYSVGVILYHLLTGRTPFDAESALGIALKHITDPVIPPSTFAHDINPALERICLRAMEKPREARFESARAMRGELRSILEEYGSALPPLPASSSGNFPARRMVDSSSRVQATAPRTTGFERRTDTIGYEQSAESARRKPESRSAPRSRGPHAGTLALFESAKTTALTEADAPRAIQSHAKTQPTGHFEQLSSNEIQVMVDEPPASRPTRRKAWLGVLLVAGSAAAGVYFARTQRAPGNVASPVPQLTEPVRNETSTMVATSAAPPTPASATQVASVAHVALAKPPPTKPKAAAVALPVPVEAATDLPSAPSASEAPIATSPPVASVAPPPPLVTAAPAPKPAFDPNTASVSIASVTNTNGLNGSSVRNALSHVPFERCYREALVAKGAPASGSATLTLSISESGYVTSATLSAPFLSSVRACIESAARTVTIKNVDTGEASSTITLSFTHK